MATVPVVMVAVMLCEFAGSQILSVPEACTGMTCLNGGVVEAGDEFGCRCNCTENFTGLMCETEIQASNWPNGPFATPMSIYGCPETIGHGWRTGHINMTFLLPPLLDSLTTFINDTGGTELLGPVSRHMMQMNFCYKLHEKHSYVEKGANWPSGSYTIYRANGSCPIGFKADILTTELPPLLRTEIDGFTADLDIMRDLEDGNTETDELKKKTVIKMNVCHRIKTNETIWNNWTTPFILLQGTDQENNMEPCPEFPLLDVLEEISPIGWRYCSYKRDREDDNSTLGMESKDDTVSGATAVVKRIRTSWITNSISDWRHYARYARLLLPGYSMDAFVHESWLLMDLEQTIEMKRVKLILQNPSHTAGNGIQSTYRDVPMVEVSHYKWAFLSKGSLRCASPMRIRPSGDFEQICIHSARYVTIVMRNFHPKNGLSSMTFFKKLRRVDVIGNGAGCGKELGMRDGGIRDLQITASSGSEPNSARPQLSGWCALAKDVDPYLQVDLLLATIVEGFIIFNWESRVLSPTSNEYKVETLRGGTTGFRIGFGFDINRLHHYTDMYGNVKTFHLDLSLPYNHPQTFRLQQPIMATIVRIHPTDELEPCLRIELIGCRKRILGLTTQQCKDISVRPLKKQRRPFVSRLPSHESSLEKQFNNQAESTCLKMCGTDNCTAVKSIGTPCYNISHKVVNGSSDDMTSWRVCLVEPNLVGPSMQIDGMHLTINKPGIITSYGYPFYYDSGYIDKWTIDFGGKGYIGLVFTHISLNKHVVENCLAEAIDRNSGPTDNIVLRSEAWKMRNSEQKDETTEMYQSQFVINSDSNGQQRSYLTRFDVLELLLHAYTAGADSVFGNGFRAILIRLDVPPCLSTSTIVGNSCLKDSNSATLSSNSFLNPGDSVAREEFWYLNGNGKCVLLMFTDLDVSCTGGAVLEVSIGGPRVRHYCNTARPGRSLKAHEGRVSIRFAQKLFEAGHPQGFRASVKTFEPDKYIGDMDIEISRERTGDYREESTPWLNACVEEFGKCYRFFGPHPNKSSDALPWAAIQCSVLFKPKAQLVTIRSKAENDFIIYQIQREMTSKKAVLKGLPMMYYAYIGLERVQDLRKLKREQWVDGNPVTYTSWAPRQPKDKHKKDCTRMGVKSLYDTNTWETTDCDTAQASFFVCEFQTRAISQDNLYKQLDQGNDTEAREGFFLCRSGDMISNFYLCDDIKDCLDGSDESNCSSHLGDPDVCPREYFRCESGGCVPVSKCCDFQPDCPDASDEYCDFPACNDKFECSNKQCIPNSLRCDLKSDCNDGSDELDCESCEETTMFRCDDGKCIPKRLLCDSFADCSNSEDERCGPVIHNSCHNWWKAGSRSSGMYPIGFGGQVECNFDRIATGVIETKYHDIEIIKRQLLFGKVRLLSILYGGGVMELVNTIKRCRQSVVQTCLPPYDMIADTDNGDSYSGSRLCHCVRIIKEGSNTTFEPCSNTSRLPPERNVTDWLASVSQISSIEGLPFTRLQLKEDANLTELRFKAEPIVCTEQVTPDSAKDLLCARGPPVDIRNKCIFEYDEYNFPYGCRDLSHLQGCENFQCPSDYVKCPRSFCIPTTLLCDGERQCPDGQDELHCWCGQMPAPARVVIFFYQQHLESTAVKIASELYQHGSDNTPTVVNVLKEMLLMPASQRGRRSYTDVPDRKVKLKRMIEIRNRITKIIAQRHIVRELIPNILAADEMGPSVQTVLIVLGTNARLSRLKDLMSFNQSIVDGVELFVLFGGNSASTSDTESRTWLPPSAKVKVVKDWDIALPSLLNFFSSICPVPDFPVCRGYYRCHASRICLPLSALCDNRSQCPHGDDEKFCDFVCPANCVCDLYMVDCSGGRFQRDILQTIPGTTRSLDFNWNNITSKPQLDKVDLRFLVTLNMSHCELTSVPYDFLNSMINLRSLDLRFNQIIQLNKYDFAKNTKLMLLDISGNNNLVSISSGTFRELVDLKNFAITGTQIQTLTGNTFFGLRLTSLDLSNNRIDAIDEHAFENLHVNRLNLEDNPISHFSRHMLKGITSLEVLQTSSFKFCCLDYLRNVDCFPRRNEFSSCEDLMRNDALRFLLWIIGVSALVGNALSLLYRLKFDRKRLKLGYGIFVTNLAVSDFLMGVYLLIIAVADSSFRGRYIQMDDWWRQSSWCSFAGVISTVSSEASIMFMCLITIDRIIVIKYPFGAIRFKTKSALAFAAIVWIIVLMLAIIPLWFTSYFKKQFYSRSGVCLAMPLTRDRPPGWEYSSSLFIGFNLLTFLLIAIGQWMIYREINASSRKTGRTTKRKQDLAVARNLLLVVSTDFLCWFPIGVMGIMAFCGYVIPGEVYAWSAVLILPINSALNPFLYTFSAIIGSKSFKPSVDEQSGTNTFTKAEVGKMIDIWNSEHFVPKKKIGLTFMPLSTYVRNKSLSVREALIITIKVTKAIRLLHSAELILGDLHFDDVCVAKINKTIKVTVKAAPKFLSRQTEKRKDVEHIGDIITTLSDNIDQRFA